MKKITKVLAIVMTLALSVMVFAACSNSGQSNETTINDKTLTDSAASGAGNESVVADDNVDYSAPAVTIDKDDYDGMKSFADAMLAGQHDDKVVKVTGVNVRSMFGAKASVMESNGDGQKIGVTYKLTDVDSIDGYPAEDAAIEIIGVVKTDENGVRYLQVPQENLKVVQ